MQFTEKNLNQFLKEANENYKSISFTFMRANPPTIGHQKVLSKLDTISRSYHTESKVYLSHTQDKKKNPLTFEEKVHIFEKAFPKINIEKDSNIRTIFDVLESLNEQGYKKVNLVVGSDRKAEFDHIIPPYLKEYNFDKFQIISAGNRIVESFDDIDMSATKLREFAINGNLEAFKSGCFFNLSEEFKTVIYYKIRERLIKEEIFQHPKMGTYSCFKLDEESSNNLHKWSKSNGIENILQPHEYHSTVVYSPTANVDDVYIPYSSEPFQIHPNTYKIGILGEALVLHYDHEIPRNQFKHSIAIGAHTEFPDYQPHISLSYKSSVIPENPPNFPITLHHEKVEPLNPEGFDTSKYIKQ